MAESTTASRRTVGDVMSTPPVVAGPQDTVAMASRRMQESRVGSVVVVEGRRAVGILTERDLVRISAAGVDPSSELVRNWMTADPDVVAPDLEVAQAWRSLSEHGYRHIPVVRDDELVGIVSMRDLMRIAQVRPIEPPEVYDAPKGLEGVVVAETGIGDVRGLEGFYHYRQYNAIELAQRRSLEDVWHLLFEGHLPDAGASARFASETRALRDVPERVAPLLGAIAAAGPDFSPLDSLRTATSLTASALGFQSWLDIDAAALRADAMRLCAVIPTLVTSMWRLHCGQEPVAPRADLGTAANYLWMLRGEVPPADEARALEQYLISTIDHGFNSSTFTARVITSTGADLGAAVVGAIGALSGPLHGGAPSRALDMLDAIGTPERTEAWIRAAVEHGDRIMGFGHRVYKTDDPRSLMLREVATGLGGPKVEFARHVEHTVVELLAELKPGRRLYTNVEFYAGVVMDRCQVPRELFTPTFACSRAIGWCAHIMEQAGDNRLIRPSARYSGERPPAPVPMPSAG